MVIKKALPRAPVVLSVEEQRRVVQFVELLVAVDQRVAVKQKRADVRDKKVQRISANKRKLSRYKDTGLKDQKINRVRNFYEPCFFAQTLYSETGKLITICIPNILIMRDFNGRHHSFGPRQQHVSHHRA